MFEETNIGIQSSPNQIVGTTQAGTIPFMGTVEAWNNRSKLTALPR